MGGREERITPSQAHLLMAIGDLQKDLMVLNDVYRVMAVDALASSHPLSSPASEVNTPAQISEVFDAISYSKVLPQPLCGPRDGGERGPGGGRPCCWALGARVPAGWGGPGSHKLSAAPEPRLPQGASVLRMLSSFLTEDLFKKGVAVSALGQPGRGSSGRRPLVPVPSLPRRWSAERGTPALSSP